MSCLEEVSERERETERGRGPLIVLLPNALWHPWAGVGSEERAGQESVCVCVCVCVEGWVTEGEIERERARGCGRSERGNERVKYQE